MSVSFQQWLKQLGIEHRRTNPYSDTENGVAERRNGVLQTMKDSLLEDSGMNKVYWGEAILTANYLVNRLWSSSANNTPYALLYGRKPSLAHLRTFGSTAWVHIPKAIREKGQQKARKLIFVGYELGSKGYLFIVGSRRVVISRSANFAEQNWERVDANLQCVSFDYNDPFSTHDPINNTDESNSGEDAERHVPPPVSRGQGSRKGRGPAKAGLLSPKELRRVVWRKSRGFAHVGHLLESKMSVKAFKLVPAVEWELLMGDRSRIHIECVECCGRNLYIGTNEGSICHFLLEEKNSPSEKTPFSISKQLHKYLSCRKAVGELKAASALNRLLVLCDNTITLMNMVNLEPISTGARIKGVLMFTLNENPVNGDPFCVEVCIVSVKRRTIQIYLVYEDKVQILKECCTREQPYAVAVDGYYLCLALTNQYIILNYNTGASQELFPYTGEEKRPIVKRIGREEFLLAAPGGLGMFATVDGISQRAPVRWSEKVIGAALYFPYVIALDEEFITVHSMLDQQQKQTLPFKDGHILQDFEGKVIVATTKGVYFLVPLPLEKQIQDLLGSRRVEEALVLAKGAKRNIPKEKFQTMYKRILQQAGFIQFAQLQFLEAKELFRSSQLDVRELISLYPLLLPTTSSFMRSHPPLHEYADLNQLTQGDPEKMIKCKQFLMTYLSDVRSTDVANGYKEDIDTALLKLYAESNHESLLDLLVSENFCLLADSAAWLEKHKKFFALGLLYHSNGQDAAALQLWIQIVNGEIQDSTRTDLYDYIVDFLTSCSDHELVWKYADWILEHDKEVGVYIFTKRPLEDQEKNSFNPDDVIKCLKKYPVSLVKYLEYLVLEKRIKKEKYHTHLAVLYLNEVLHLKSLSAEKQEKLMKMQTKLRSLLQRSDLYRVHFILDKIAGTDLHAECAILYGKLEEHEKALRILVHELKDFSAAEDYCLWNSESKGLPYRRKLFHMLLSTYLNSSTPNHEVVNMAAVDLLNNHAAEFDAAWVLQLIPASWSVQLLSSFLMGAMRESLHSQRMAEIALSLAKAENLIYKNEKVKLRESPVLLSDKKLCQVCQKPFCEPAFVRYPNDTVVHTHCAAKRLVNSNTNHHLSSSSGRT